MPTTIKRLGDKEVVALFVDFLAHKGYPDLEIERIPDEEVSGEIDAIAGQFAIEHTSIDTIPHQRRDEVWFMESFGSLEQEFKGKLLFRLFLTFPYAGVRQGQNWQELKTAVQHWIMTKSEKLSEGSHIISNIPGIPFEFRARKKCSGKAGLLLSRFGPYIPDFPSRLKKHLARKIKKLAPYKGKGKTTLLLVESADIAFMDEAVMYDSLSGTYPAGLPSGVDQVWFAHTSIPEDVLFFEMNEAFRR
jgi:hypothetical protein